VSASFRYIQVLTASTTPLDLAGPRRMPPKPVRRDAAQDHALEGYGFDPLSFATAKLAATAQW